MNSNASQTDLKILVADDDRDIRNGVCLRLRMAGHNVLEANDGLEALRKVDTDRPDMVILDIRMPRMDGMSVLEQLQADGRTRDIPIVVMSASLVQRDQALDAGAVGFLPKPHDGRELLRIIETVRQHRCRKTDGPHGTEIMKPRLEAGAAVARFSKSFS